MFKVNNRNTRIGCEICSKLTIKTLEQHQRQMPLLYTLNITQISCSSVSVVDFENAIACWV